MAIFLLHEELKKVVDIAKEDMIGMIRIAWWRENLEDIFLHNKNKDHYLLRAISVFKSEVDFTKLELAFEGFNLDFSENKSFSNKEELYNYVVKTYGSFFEIIFDILQIKEAKIARNLALISFYFDLLKKIKKEDEKVVRFFYPNFFSELKIDAQFWQKNNSEKNYDKNLSEIVKYIVQEIEVLAQEIKIFEKELGKRERIIMMQKELILLIIQNLKKNNFDIFSVDLGAKKLLMKLKFLLCCFVFLSRS
ncbi:MAG: hypothetical protein FJ368_02240 [Pelagibacterales bacterium]|nr:hypothetical protein [Pelagibacterales bacterium]